MSVVYALEKQLQECKEALINRELALKLHSNSEFKKLILEDFCVTECARYAQLSGDHDLDEKTRAESLAMAQAAGHLRRYLSMIVTKGNQAERLIPDIETEIEVARQEDNE